MSHARNWKCTGTQRLWYAFINSFNGLRLALVTEAAFRQEVLLAAILIPAALLLPIPLFSKGIMIASIVLVLTVEILNSAIEALCDLVCMDDHPLAKRAKDLGSAAVMMSLVLLAVVWIGAIVHYMV
ncbi:MAG: diacylglycerol kinase [bacterium]